MMLNANLSMRLLLAFGFIVSPIAPISLAAAQVTPVALPAPPAEGMEATFLGLRHATWVTVLVSSVVPVITAIGLVIRFRMEAAERRVERTADLRRDVYLRAAAELAKVHSHLAALAHADPAKRDGAGLQPFFEAAVQLQVIAQSDTALAVVEAAARYRELGIRQYGRGRRSELARRALKECDDILAAAVAEADRASAESTAMRGRQGCEAKDLESLGQIVQAQAAKVAAAAAARDIARAECSRLDQEAMRAMYRDLSSLRDVRFDMLAGIRRDLGFDTDTEGFRARLFEAEARAEALAEDLRVNSSGGSVMSSPNFKTVGK